MLLYIAMLLFAIYIVMTFYICDNGTCKVVQDAKGDPKELLNNIGNQGIWALPFIGASLITLFFILYLRRFDVATFIITFLLAFLTIYLLFSFFIHHYIKPTIEIASELEENKDTANIGETNEVDEPNEDISVEA